MNTGNFSIVGIYIDELCDEKIRKILKPGYYPIDNQYRYNDKEKTIELNEDITPLNRNFFGSNITISAIVGMNGSGKTSLLDIIYRIINNFAHKYRLVPKKGLIFVPNVVAKLFFVMNNTTYTIDCNGKKIGFYQGSSPINRKDESFKNIFYTIVLNYSFSAFISQDYIQDTKEPRYHGDGDAWIDKIFHKNDGYQTPIVINPFRDKGIIKIASENNLTRSRLSALLIEAQKSKKQIIEGYLLDNIRYKLNVDKILSCSKSIESKGKRPSSTQQYELKFDLFASAALGAFFPNETLNIIKILNRPQKKVFLSVDTPCAEDFLFMSYVYLVYKVQKIVEIYPFYQQYKNVCDTINEKGIEELISEINKDNTHITLKIKQTLNFIEKVKAGRNKNFTEFNISDLGIKTRKLYEIMENLPPSFYNFEIYLKKANNSGNKIAYSKLSSGEKQFIYNISTILYHVKNILSIKPDIKNRISYQNINIVLDEIELCFHPEYQRTFINNLVNTLKRLKLTNKRKFNIIIATHSPFILSDIPEQNILFLKEGEEAKMDYKTFGANISDLLKHNFFLDSGFLGEFAAQKIEKIIEKIKKVKCGTTTPDEYDEIATTINLIGEPLIKDKLLIMLDEKIFGYDKKTILKKRKERLERELQTIDKALKRKSNVDS